MLLLFDRFQALNAFMMNGGFGVFVLWRFYDIIMVRENFWVLLVPIVLIGVVIFAALTGGNAPNNSAQPAAQAGRKNKVARTSPAIFEMPYKDNRVISEADIAANPKLFEKIDHRDRIAWLEYIVDQPKWNESDRKAARRILDSLPPQIPPPPPKPRATVPKTIESKPIKQPDPRSAFDIPPQRLDE